MATNRKEKFRKAVEDLLHRLGAVKVNLDYLTLLHTIAGPLHCKVCDWVAGPPFVAMYFEYAGLAERLVGSSAFCGKWNFHPETADAAAVKQLEERLRAILIKQEEGKHENA